ncbi:hypothetical protein ABZ540_17165 [Nocardia xishanensis]|uniref:hypothetical protein n=1 Tax=Nocardia xishanensis TaxID=238964 RepID=UPI0033FE2007
MAAGRGRESARAAEVGDVVPVGGQRPLGGEVVRQAEHVQLGRDAVAQRLREIVAEHVGVRAISPGSKVFPAPSISTSPGSPS